jgi:EAL domain-containing protein (putative c-di-GMP-specific phosphodiesterase class I)
VSRAKDSGGGRLEVFPALPHPDSRRRLTLAAQLSRALSQDHHAALRHGEALHGEGQHSEGPDSEGQHSEGPDGGGPDGEVKPGGGRLALAYRPVADLASSQIIGAEALPRWRGDGADVARPEFLAAAEIARVTTELGDWMLRESCAQAASWWRDGWEASLWLRSPAGQTTAPFSESVLGALTDSGLAPAALVLEVALPVLADGGDGVLRGLGELRERGVRLAVDVSEAGYGSLARLSRHPVDLVRIGPDLVAGLGVDAAAETLIKALVRVGKDLGIQVVADGIERAGQRDLLAAMGCVLGLGPYVDGPVPPASIPGHAGGHGGGGAHDPAGDMTGGHGRAGGHGVAGEQTPFGDVISPARHLAS